MTEKKMPVVEGVKEMEDATLHKGVSSTDRSKAKEYLRQGVKAQEKCNLREALALFKKATKANSTSLKALEHKAQLLEKFGKYKEAEKCYEKLLHYCHKDFKTLKDNATLYSLLLSRIKNKKKLKEELVIVGKLVERHPRSIELRLIEVDIISYLMGNTRALELINKILYRFPQSNKVWEEKRLLLHLSEKYDELFEHLDKELKKFPNETFILYNKAQALRESGKLHRALGCWETLIKKDKTSRVEALESKAEILVETKKYKEAIKTLDKLLGIKYKIGSVTYSLLSRWIQEIRPDYLNIWLLKARAFKGLKRYREAVECYEIVDRMSGDAYEAYISTIKERGECSRKLAHGKKVEAKKNG
ncbi:MAG: tetratricopeptide repeat protein [Nanoarchaeota archaeon]|nr:tetratricopeptide repeat protein [Nanoarchaeota archaeon]